MRAASPVRLAGRTLPAVLVVFYGCSDASAPTAPRIESRVHALAAPVVVVTNTDDAGAGSLRQAIADAADGSVIQFDTSIAGKTILLTSGSLFVLKPLTIEGPASGGITISAGARSRVLAVAAAGDLTLRNMSIVNGFEEFGGGMIVHGQLTLDHSLVAFNEATSEGGGVLVENDGNMVVINSTISGNHSRSAGGGIYAAKSVVLRNSTVANNSAHSGGGIFLSQAFLSLWNTIVADNTSDPQLPNTANCDFGQSAVSYAGRNLSNDENCGNDPSMVIGSPSLDALADNGGPTMTQAIRGTSAALNRGTNCSEATDQRYVLRNQGSSCDIGAFEFNDYGTYTFTIGPNVSVNPKTGIATVTGTIKCSRSGSGNFFVSMSQAQKLTGKYTTIVQGIGGISIASCTTTPSAWSTTITPASGKFENGTATVSLQFASMPVDFVFTEPSATVKVYQGK